jgi:hypothetical protein
MGWDPSRVIQEPPSGGEFPCFAGVHRGYLRPVYVDCVAEWADDPLDKQRIWELFTSADAPLGYDPAPFFIAPDHPNFGVLKLTPWRVAIVTQSPPLALVWRNEPTSR